MSNPNSNPAPHPASWTGAALADEFPAGERTLPVLLARRAAALGERPFVTFADTTLSFAAVERLAATAARTLVEAGIAKGDRVAIMAANRIEFLEVFLGCAWIGAIAVPINTASRGVQLAHILTNSGAKLIVIEHGLLPSLQSAIEAGGPAPGLIRTLDGARDAAGKDPAPPPMPAAGERAEAAALRPGDTIAILYTSGTTGPSKGVCCPHAQMFWWGVNTGKAFALTADDVLFTTLPLFHTNALNTFFQALLHGCRFVVLPKFSASGFWHSAREHGATVTYLLGAMAAILLSRPPAADDRDHAIRAALGGGVPGRFHGPFLERFGVPLLDAYGSTETNFVFGSPIPSDHPGTMGYLVDGMEARVVDEDDAPLPDGEAGELILRAHEPFAFATGYFAMPDKTVEAWRNLWFHTGDRVVREKDGHYRFIDRTKDAIRRRGENISSWEVEQTLLAHPAVEACAAYPLPSELGEDEVAVAVVLVTPGALLPLDIVRHCEGKLPYFAVPRFVRIVSSMPLTENGKIRKFALRDEGRVADLWDREEAGYRIRR
ncbi:MAG: ATP-dependent acyl-CoA ligase [Pseudochelatococcus sp.]|uniref:ATP-dependent acyl-CoA ligase n=1 Tax=Pseudochelatococcus sp. TaxID=2020869 RepID=UPI003D92618A